MEKKKKNFKKLFFYFPQEEEMSFQIKMVAGPVKSSHMDVVLPELFNSQSVSTPLELHQPSPKHNSFNSKCLKSLYYSSSLNF